MSGYAEFLERKRRVWAGAGIESADLPERLFDWQAAIIRWALRKGRAAIFADCGLGKTPMQLAWAQATGQRTLILAPLCVADQTAAEGAKFGIPVHYAADQSQAGPGISVTNYERLHLFDPSAFGAVVLDESSILKSFDGKTRSALIAAWGRTRFRLCCTATPAPNDIAELANHAEFLGLVTRSEFLATWFVHDDEGWRMKKHAVKPFYRWLASWAVALRHPSDLGYPDDGFILPELRIHDAVIPAGGPMGGMLFPSMAVKGIQGRLAARRGSLTDRVAAAASLMNGHDSWIAWCGLNQESEALAAAVPDALEVCGNDSYAEKVGAVHSFVNGETRALVTKARILGFGMNFQHCSRMVFVGLSDSYETYYQCIRREWRYGQTQPVDVWIVVSEAEQAIVDNVRRKEQTAASMARDLLAEMTEFEREELTA